MTDHSPAERTSTPNPLAQTWTRISPSLVPVLAVLTALLVTIPFMIATGGDGDLGRGLNIAGTAYSALLEGSLGLAINDRLTPDDLPQVIQMARSEGELTSRELRGLANDIDTLNTLAPGEANSYLAVFEKFPELDDEQLTALAESVEEIKTIGPESLALVEPLVRDLSEMSRGDVRDLTEDYARMEIEDLTAEARAELEAVAPSAADYSGPELLTAMDLLDEEGIVKLERILEQQAVLADAGVVLDAPELATLARFSTLREGAADARELADVAALLERAGITDLAALTEQIALVRAMYEDDLLTQDIVDRAIVDELPQASADNLLVRRPGNRLLVDRTNEPFGVIEVDMSVNNVQVTRPEAVYLRLGSSAFLFFPQNLETMIVRSIPFIIAGLAVALGFKAGLFNIGAEGQLYAGALLAVWIGFSQPFISLPPLLHIPLVIIGGIVGGALWGAIPGLLKAYTGAHEVIVTIMLNFVAVLFVDWLIKSTNPLLLGDPTSSVPRTPFIAASAILPTFDNLPPWVFILAALVVFGVGFWFNRGTLRTDRSALIRLVVYSLLTLVGGLFLSWISVGGNLHIGLVLMIAAVWFTEWFLNRTTFGFELRTVGTNADAARYAGMSVPRNIVFAMMLSGALAGLAGVVEVSGVQYNVQPAFFSGLGFDAIAVALLARINPRNMIPAGLLWGSLLAGAGLMQIRADLSIDLVKVIQALIIMFIAADIIIRTLWRVPKSGEKTATTFSKGWGG